MDTVTVKGFRELPPGPEAPLKQHILLLENEVQALQRKLQEAHRRIAALEGRDPQQALDEVMEALRKLEQARISRELAEREAQKAARSQGEKPERKKFPGHGPKEQTSLPAVTEVFDLPANERKCPVCAGEMVPLGEQFEESEDIHVIERQYVQRTIKRRKYRCSCNSCVTTTPGPPRVIPGGRYSLDVALEIAIEKYLDHIPLERQVRRMERLGLIVTSQALYDQLNGLALVLTPTYERLGELVLEAKVIHADETRWPRLDGKGLCNWTVWTRTNPDIAHFAILESRSTSAARVLFKGYQGTIVVDGYKVYECLAAESKVLQLSNCWAHTLRNFRELEENFPHASARILELIGKLYDVERKVPGPFPGDSAAQQQRLALRKEKSVPLLNDIKHWAENEIGLPRSALGKAVRYMLKRWQALTRFVENPLIPLDNNAAERSLRGLVVGRKVHYGSKSRRGTEVAAVLYTLLETAKLCGINPAAYLREATLAAMATPGRILLPREFRAQSAPQQ